MASPVLIMEAQRKLIVAQRELIAVSNCVETQDYQAANLKYIQSQTYFNNAIQGLSMYEFIMARSDFINAQKEFLRAQVTLLEQNNVYESQVHGAG